MIVVIAGLAEGSSLRALTRITGVHGTTIADLALRVGAGCARLLDEKMRNLHAMHIPPATSPRKAVQGSIVSEYRKREANAES
jgi:hypothetical protein